MDSNSAKRLAKAFVSLVFFALLSVAVIALEEVPSAEPQVLLEGLVTRVVDGDTLDVVIDGQVERVRLIGVDTPETVDPRKKVQCFGAEASAELKRLVEQQIVSLEFDDSQGRSDKYGRELAYVFLSDGTNVNETLLRNGFAYEYTYSKAYKYQNLFQNAEQVARDTESGLWSSETCGGNR